MAPSAGTQTVAAWPEHVPSWWHLAGCVAELEPEPKAQVVAVLRETRFAGAQAQWFQQSALHHVTGDAGCLLRQAELAFELPGAERWMTLINLAWWTALSRAADRSSFRQFLIDVRMPELLAGLGSEIDSPERARDASGELRRVAIVAQHLSTGQHAPTALAFNMRAVLETAGIGTCVFGLQELDLPAMRGHTAGGYVSTVAALDAGTWQLRTPGEVSVTAADTRFSLASRWSALARLIDEYDPDVVLFVGFYSPLVWPLGRRFPVVGLSLHAMPPLAPVDVWLAAQADAGARAEWPGLRSPLPVHYPFRFWPEPAASVSRSEVNVSPESVLLITCGARLDPEVLAEWIADVVLFLGEHETVHWLLVGLAPADGERIARRHPRIRVLPHRADVAGWIAVSDLYLNPPRVGGGATVAIAMQLGVPVVAMTGGDGGDKIAPQAAATRDAYRERLAHWVADSGARSRESGRPQGEERAELDVSSPDAAGRLLDACRQAQRLFAQRAARPAASADRFA
jgi:hypothetical protein